MNESSNMFGSEQERETERVTTQSRIWKNVASAKRPEMKDERKEVKTQQKTKTLKAAHARVSMEGRHITDKHVCHRALHVAIIQL